MPIETAGTRSLFENTVELRIDHLVPLIYYHYTVREK